MALQKQSVTINFQRGLDTKTDPFQVTPGAWLELENSIFTKGGLLQKRNGFGPLTPLPLNASLITTYSQNLVTLGPILQYYSADNEEWIDKGPLQHTSLSITPVVRNSIGQVSADIVVDVNGLACVVYYDAQPDNLPNAFYRVFDSVTGQTSINETALPSNAYEPRVFILGQYFVITYIFDVGGNYHLQFTALSRLSATATPIVGTLAINAKSIFAGYDAIVAGNDILYYALQANTGGGAIFVGSLNVSLGISTPVSITGYNADLVSMAVDNSPATPNLYISFWDSGSSNLYLLVISYQFAVITAPAVKDTQSITALTSTYNGTGITAYYQILSTYSWNSVRDDYIYYQDYALITGTIYSLATYQLGCGLASKALYVPSLDNVYVLVVYPSTLEPTYFCLDQNANIVTKIAPENAGGYAYSYSDTNYGQVLPCFLLNAANAMQCAYLFQDFLATLATTATTSTPPVYTQLGVNLATIDLSATDNLNPSEIAGLLNVSGGVTYMYDGTMPVELGFHVYPENIGAAQSVSGDGNVDNPGTYFYYVTYEWTDSIGNIHRSAPSIPYEVMMSGSNNTVTLSIPTLRLTAKTSVRIVVYRYSAMQPIPYQVTPVGIPTLNNPDVNFVTFTDIYSNAQIDGKNVLYTFGGVLEDIAPPASSDSALFNARLFLVTAEDQNLLWYSKQVISATTVELSDLLTIYLQPNAGIQGTTAGQTSIFPMDDKLIIFKKEFIYYINGIGPDNTGANNGFSDPVLITATIGCTNKKSIVFMPNGLMFQSDKGIWLLGRDLSTNYIGAPVEQYNSATVLAANTIPGTNQVRFTLDSGLTLMYDYYFSQWSVFSGVPAISSTIYQSEHTYLDQYNNVYQETPNQYTDQNGRATLLYFQSGWYSLAGLQGFERFYQLLLLGAYLSPFKLQVDVAYDFADSPGQASTYVTPENSYQTWGSQNIWGGDGAPWGGAGTGFTARIFPQIQKCSSFQITVQELPNITFNGQQEGAGLTLSAMNLVVGLKKGYRTQKAGRTFTTS